MIVTLQRFLPVHAGRTALKLSVIKNGVKHMKKAVMLIAIGLLSAALCGCTQQEAAVDSAPSASPAAAQAGTDSGGSGRTLSFDNYIQSFASDVNLYLTGDFQTLIDGAMDADSAEWRASFAEGAEKAQHWVEEYGAAQIIVSEDVQQTYQTIGNIMGALQNLFTTYSALGEEGKGTEEQRAEFSEAAQAIQVIWAHEMENL